MTGNEKRHQERVPKEGPGPRGDRQSEGTGVLVATSGKESEKFQTIPITRQKRADKQVVIELKSGGQADRSLPDLQPGDLLEVSAELEVTTDCEVQEHSNCVKNAYTYAPTARASLILAAGPEVTDSRVSESVALAASIDAKCTHVEHHKMIVFTGASYRIPARPPQWMLESPSINLVISADHEKAEPGDVLLIGQNDPGKGPGGIGGVGQDQGRINAVRIRGHRPEVRPKRTTHRRAGKVPIDIESKTVLYSFPLDDLQAGEQLVADASVIVKSALDYPARFSTRVILADSAEATDPVGRQADLAPYAGELSQNNGTNCLPHAAQTVARKVGVATIQASAKDRVYVNLVAVGGDPLKQEKGSDELKVLDGGYLRVTRYAAALKG